MEKGREPKGQTVISFFADPPMDPMEQERVGAATDVLEIALRDILREELGQTYTVSVDLSEPLPQRGAGHVAVSFGAAPENIGQMTDRVLEEVQKMQKAGPSADLLNRAKESARRNYETALKQNPYWLGRLRTRAPLRSEPGVAPAPRRAHRCVDRAERSGRVPEIFPDHRDTVVTLVLKNS